MYRWRVIIHCSLYYIYLRLPINPLSSVQLYQRLMILHFQASIRCRHFIISFCVVTFFYSFFSFVRSIYQSKQHEIGTRDHNFWSALPPLLGGFWEAKLPVLTPPLTPSLSSAEGRIIYHSFRYAHRQRTTSFNTPYWPIANIQCAWMRRDG